MTNKKQMRETARRVYIARKNNGLIKRTVDVPDKIIKHIEKKLDRIRGSSKRKPHKYTVKRALEKLIVKYYKEIEL